MLRILNLVLINQFIVSSRLFTAFNIYFPSSTFFILVYVWVFPDACINFLRCLFWILTMTWTMIYEGSLFYPFTSLLVHIYHVPFTCYILKTKSAHVEAPTCKFIYFPRYLFISFICSHVFVKFILLAYLGLVLIVYFLWRHCM